MRYFLMLLALSGLFVAARPHTPPPTRKAVPAAKGGGSASVFARFDLAPFWRVSASEGGDKVHNGFFSYSYQRLEMAFTSVRRDAQNPSVYHVRGKNRRYNIVRAFAGTFTLDNIKSNPSAKLLYADKATGTPYTATGQFVLREQPRAGDEAYGTFRGRLAVDLAQLPKGRLQLSEYTANEQTQKGGFLLDGTWKDAGSEAEVYILVKNGMAVTQQVLENFDVGERSPRISQRYARVGWNRYWGNDEWWADSPVAKR